jgi:hypothetical protein
MKEKENKVAKQIPKKSRYPDPAEWFAELDRLRGDSLFPEGRNQPILQARRPIVRDFRAAKRKRIKEELARLAFGKK